MFADLESLFGQQRQSGDHDHDDAAENDVWRVVGIPASAAELLLSCKNRSSTVKQQLHTYRP